MIRFRPLLWMTLFSIVALIILITLGDWQWSRYQQKLAARDAPAPAMALSSFTPLPGRVQLVYGIENGKAEWRVFVPVAHGDVTTFLDTGVVPGLAAPDWKGVPEPFADGPMAVKGLPITPPKPSWAAPKPDPAKHAWFAIDLQAMGQAAGLKSVTPYYLALPYVGADGALRPNPFADPHAADALPPERHLGYALTWWGLAGALLAVYAAFHARAGRLSFGRKA